MTDINNFERYPVVLVEDDPVLAVVLAAQLQAAGVNFCVAVDGHQALALIQLHRPRVIILDVNLPGLSGFEIAERLREEPTFEGLETLKVIVYTSLDLNESERQSLILGAGTVFYTKTIEDIDLGQIVKQYLSNL